MDYRNTKISLSEHFPPTNGATLSLDYGYFTVESSGPIFVAESTYGRSFAGTTEKALRGAKDQVDTALDMDRKRR